jgi:hypothetical protein
MKKKIGRLARQEGKTISKLVSELIEESIRIRNVASYIDELWSRIRVKIRTKGIRPEDIPRIIRRTRVKPRKSR